MKKLFILFFTITIISCNSEIEYSEQLDQELQALLESESPTGDISYFILPSSHQLDLIPQDPRNPLTPQKVELGNMLFHETALGVKAKNEDGVKTFSCASCHHAQAGFQAGIKQGIGDGGMGFGTKGEGRVINPLYQIEDLDVQPIRTPTALNAAYQEISLWNGQFGSIGMNEGTDAQWTADTPKETNHLGYSGIETQAIAGLKVHRLDVDYNTPELNAYKKYFDLAFPNIPKEDRYSNENAGLALAAYERTLLADQAPFQKWLKGDKNAMTSFYMEGALLFFGKANCNQCHDGPALNSNNFYALGMNDLGGFGIYGDVSDDVKKGRGGFTQREEDMYKFKVPQLYSLRHSPFYGHGGSFESITDIITYKNDADPQNDQVPSHYISPEFEKLGLTDDEIWAISVFVEHALDDRNLMRYEPDHTLSGNCFPNSDYVSNEDLNCD